MKTLITNPERLIFPKKNIRKGQIIEYYKRSYPLMKRYLKDKAVTLKRFVDTITGADFFQRNASEHYPKDNKLLVGDKNLIIAPNFNALSYLVNQGGFEIYTMVNNITTLQTPERLVIDLDPPGNGFELTRRAAKEIKSILDSVNIASFLMTTGSKGLHIIIPVKGIDFIEGKKFIKAVCQKLIDKDPSHFTMNSRLEGRSNKLYLDYTRNSSGQVTIAPYSLRAKQSAAIATPVDWSELDRKEFNSQYYTIDNIKLNENPWKNYWSVKNNVPKAIEKLKEDRTYAWLSNEPQLLMQGIVRQSNDAARTLFHKDFRPSYTPMEMLRMGVFGGAYFRLENLRGGIPPVIKTMDKRLWMNPIADPQINYYKVLAGLDLDFWLEKDLIHKDDPNGWFEWYCKYYYGRRHQDDDRQIRRWRSFVARHGAQAYGKPGRERQRQALLQWAWNNDLDPREILETYK